MRMTVEITVEIDLHTLPVKDWPPAAQELARTVLMKPTQRRHFQSLPLPERKEWLVNRMQAIQDMVFDMTMLLN